eukprot:TRINITY_DN1384_c0_g1_i2.p1 TRINITY_DN1384_c0_g1~~TRINITY_DN1384_c0_g1_i2.p1  ORF type:complete len:353 (-),score=89.44 TRINITY_DN1384_c0_g1_i2:59-1117(-)
MLVGKVYFSVGNGLSTVIPKYNIFGDAPHEQEERSAVLTSADIALDDICPRDVIYFDYHVGGGGGHRLNIANIDVIIELKRNEGHYGQVMNQYYESRSCSDMSVVLSDGEEKVHSFLMALSSPFFDAVISRWSKEDRTVLNLEDISRREFDIILQILYKQQVTIESFEMLEKLLEICGEYQILEVLQMIEEEIAQSLTPQLAEMLFSSNITFGDRLMENITLCGTQIQEITSSDNLVLENMGDVAGVFVIVNRSHHGTNQNWRITRDKKIRSEQNGCYLGFIEEPTNGTPLTTQPISEQFVWDFMEEGIKLRNSSPPLYITIKNESNRVILSEVPSQWKFVECGQAEIERNF